MTDAWGALFGPGPLVVDGGLSTQLAAMGEDISGRLWTARVLLENPASIVRAHSAFVDAGAGVVITASYQVSREGFLAAGLTTRQSDEALAASVHAAREAAASGRGAPVRVAASVGPYGAILHDGSEYRGHYGRTRQQLADFHRERLDVLVACAPDLLAVETIPDVAEAEAIVDVLADHPTVPAWMTFSAADDARLCAGQPIEDAVAVASSAPSVMAVGVNCTDPRHVAGLVRRIRRVSDLPVVVYPNAGGRWDAADGQWHGSAVDNPHGAFPDVVVREWVDAGARGVGGCCGTDARAISGIARLLAPPAG